MMQFFQWYDPYGGVLWNLLKSNSQKLADTGFTSIWIPPAYKGSGGPYDVGYGCYDLFDLGEFNQKNSVPTKYGTKDQLLAAITAAQSAGLQVYADVVFNHKDGGDYTEDIQAQQVDWNDRNRAISDWYTIKIWTGSPTSRLCRKIFHLRTALVAFRRRQLRSKPPRAR